MYNKVQGLNYGNVENNLVPVRKVFLKKFYSLDLISEQDDATKIDLVQLEKLKMNKTKNQWFTAFR